MFWFQQGLCALPAFLGIWSSATFIISFVIAVLRHDIDVFFPYISDTGAIPPESCFFGLMTFICACAGILNFIFDLLGNSGLSQAGKQALPQRYSRIGTIYARYKFVEKLIEENNLMKPCCNKASLFFGLGSCFGMSIVATFQETAVGIFHDIGALLFFASGVIYMITQCWISYTAHPYDCARSVSVIRVGLTVVAAVALFPTIICGLLSSKTSLHWDKEEKQYALHVTSAICEWTVAFSFVFFFFTYIHDFKRFTLQVTTVYEQPF